MTKMGFWKKITGITLGKLCQQPVLLAGLALLCVFLPHTLGRAAEAALSEGISFSGITLAVTAPEGDQTARLLENLLPKLEGIGEYCHAAAMSREEALAGLESGEVTAVLVLPENLVRGIMDGTNPDVQLIIPEDMPLEALLTLSVGQSASDLLAAVQSGVYAVLEQYSRTASPDLTYPEVVTQINMRYIRWTLGRQQMFREERIPVTGQLPVGIHYGLSLLAWLGLCLAPVFMPAYSGLSSQRRYRAAGRGPAGFYGSSLLACGALLLPVMAAGSAVLTGGSFPSALVCGTLAACFCAVFASVCCLICRDGGSCGMLSFCLGLVFLFLSGGILPPVLLPGTLGRLAVFSPVTWLREILAGRLSDRWGIWAAAAAAAAAGLLIPGYILFRRGQNPGEGRT